MSGTQDQGSGAGGGDDRAWLGESFRADPVFANFKTPDDLANSYKSAASMVGMDKGRVLALPKDEADDAGWGGVYDKLGRPAKPEEYGIAAEGQEGEMWKAALPEMHKLGLTKKQVAGLKVMMDGMGQSQAQAMADPAKAMEAFLPRISQAISSEAFADTTANTLKGEWGQAFDDKMHAANRVVAALIETGDADIAKVFQPASAGGYGLANLPGVAKMLAEIGGRLAEPGGVVGGTGQNQGARLTPSQAAAEVARMSGDKAFGARVLAGDAEAVRQWDAANAALGPR